jgi:ornithine lipid ester-linked acyl 2-hydroxylase
MNSELFLDALQKSYTSIKAEFNSVSSEGIYSKWPEEFIYNEGWNVFGLRFNGNDLAQAHAICPYISGFIKRYNRLITTLGFSVLNPGTIIYPHVGYTNAVLRCHLGISVPEGDCCLRVGEKVMKWEEGAAFIFDDTIEHEAWNKTDQKRIVMLLDLNKEVLYNVDYMGENTQ